MTPSEVHTLECDLSNSFARLNLTNDELSSWETCKRTVRFNVYTGRLYVIWHMFLGAPRVAGSITIGAPSLSEDGLSCPVDVTYEGKSYSVTLNHHPVGLVHKRIFAHFPFSPQLSYLPRTLANGTQVMSLRFPIVVKTEGGIKIPKEGELNVSPVSEFKWNYPQFKDMVL